MPSSIQVEDVPEEVLERILNSRGFRKMVLYEHLSEGIKALEEDGNLKSDLAGRIAERHSSVRSADSILEVFNLLVDEVRAFTEPVTSEVEDDPVEPHELEDLFVDDDPENGGTAGGE